LHAFPWFDRLPGPVRYLVALVGALVAVGLLRAIALNLH